MSPRAPHPLLGWPRRMLLGAWAVAGTVVFGWSYTIPGPSSLPPGLMVCIAVSAALAWPWFGLALGLFGQGVPLVRWADVCLRTMSIGMGLLLGGAAMKILGLSVPAGFHLALVLGSCLLMTFRFLGQCEALGLSRTRAQLLWGLGLLAPFLLLMLFCRWLR